MKRLYALLLAAMLLALTATAALAEPKDAPDAFVLGAEDNLDADIVVVQALDMVSWDPTNTSDLSNGYVINNVYGKLFTFDADLNGIPEMCESYNRVSDTEWHFKIYEGIKCHDGSILTADDVVHSLNRTKNGTAIGALFGPVNEITKIDDLTISITTNGPYPALPTALTHQACCIVPQAYAEAAGASDDWSHPIGSGRYTFNSRLIGDSIKLDRFDDYFNQDDKALNKSLTFKVIPEGSSRTIAIETGTADFNVDFNTVDYNRVVNDSNVALWRHYSQTVWHLGMDNTNEWFSNPLVRQAVNFAVDRAGCLEVGHNGQGTVMYNCATFAPTCLGAIDNPLGMYEYNPERAKELMAEAGCPGFDTEIIVFRDEAERIAQVVQADLAEIGINAQIKRIENAVFASTIAEHGAPMFVTSWGAYWDPDLFLARRFGTAGIGGVNRVWYLNEELDKLVVEGRSSFDDAARAETYKKVQEFLAVEAPECDLYVSVMFALANKDLKGVEINVERPYNYYKLHY
ncbi:MAG: ABC transporter substrate-binding protein [Firmicutes bacterium]|nr:ABC transporter substrate-binding protein [Bacillota bacterium]